MLKLFRDRNFFILWIGEFVSVIGSHISVVAFPFLVLQLTGSPAQMGLVLAAQGLPRAVLMLVGGAIVDRYSPRMVMMVSNAMRFVLLIVLAGMIDEGMITLPIIYVLAIVFGFADAFFYPAATSIVPSVVDKDDLKAGNAIMQGSTWVGVIFGPAIAAFAIAGELTTIGHGAAPEIAPFAESQAGYARAFFLDALTFAFSFITLLFVRARSLRGEEEETQPSMIGEVAKALKWVWSMPAIRLGFIGIAVLEFFFQTSIFVGLLALTEKRFVEAEFVYGLIVSAYGVGALVGAVTAGFVSWPSKREQIVPAMFVMFTGSGATIGLIVLYEPYWFAMVLFLIFGALDSYIWVHFMTFLQQSTPESQMGRVMSIMMFMSVGLIPVASVVLGAAFEWNLEIALMTASAILTISSLVMALHPDSRKVPELVESAEA